MKNNTMDSRGLGHTVNGAIFIKEYDISIIFRIRRVCVCVSDCHIMYYDYAYTCTPVGK